MSCLNQNILYTRICHFIADCQLVQFFFHGEMITIQYCFFVLERRHGRVVRAAWLWCRNSPQSHEFEAGLSHATTRKLSLSTQQQMGTFFELGKQNGSERRGMGFAFHFLYPRYSGTLSFTAPKAIRRWETFTFT